MSRLLAWLGTLPAWCHVLTVAAVPVVELRGAIPLGVHLGLRPLEAMGLALLGNLAPIPVLYYILLPAFRYLRRTRLFRRAVGGYLAHSEKRAAAVKKYGLWGLALFVAVPLPGTGAWTGCLIALLLGYSLRSALAALALGTLGAGLAVTALTVLAGL